jgi:hypothetical protein
MDCCHSHSRGRELPEALLDLFVAFHPGRESRRVEKLYGTSGTMRL